MARLKNLTFWLFLMFYALYANYFVRTMTDIAVLCCDVTSVPDRQVSKMLEKAVWYFFLGFLYNLLYRPIFQSFVLPQVKVGN